MTGLHRDSGVGRREVCSSGAPLDASAKTIEHCVSHCFARIQTLLAYRDSLQSSTAIDIDFLRHEPREWADHEGQLDAALATLRALPADTTSALLAKFRCYDLLLDAFGGEDRRVINLNDALLLECRKYLDRTAPLGLTIDSEPL